MPNLPLRPCGKVGCNELTQERYCQHHQVAEARRYEQERGTAAQRGYDERWRKARKLYLRHHPLCVECEKQGLGPVPATVVDHIKPHKGDRTLFWNSNNWQSMCASCHSAKTVSLDGGFGNPMKG